MVSQSQSRWVVSDSLRPYRLYSPWYSLGPNTEVGSLSLLQGIFPTQGSIPGLPHCRRILYQLSHKGGPRILEWVRYPFSSGSSKPKNRTRVFWIAGGFFTYWAIREDDDGTHIIRTTVRSKWDICWLLFQRVACKNIGSHATCHIT